MFSETLIDILRGLHLLCFAAGMGVGLCFDLRTMRTLNTPINADDVWTLHQVHVWIMAAFGGLWITGLALVYVRTGFDLAAFTPKLWTKLAVMSLMVANSVAIACIVMPTMQMSIGRTLTRLPAARLALITQIATTSLFCWFAGMALGSSAVLKTAGWGILVPLGLGTYGLLSLGSQALVWEMRRQARHQRPDPFLRLRKLG